MDFKGRGGRDDVKAKEEDDDGDGDGDGDGEQSGNFSSKGNSVSSS